MDLKRLAYDLTMSTVEVEDAVDLGASFHDMVVGEIKEVLPHPDADKLRICRTDIGGGDIKEIVCGGTAIRQGCTGVTQLEMMPCPPTCRAPGNDWPEWPRVLKTDYGQQEAIAKFGSDPRLYKTTVKEFYKNENGQVCGALIAKLESLVNLAVSLIRWSCQRVHTMVLN